MRRLKTIRLSSSIWSSTMTRSTSIKTRFVLWLTLLAFCAGGGCAAVTYRNSEPSPYTVSWKRKLVSCEPPFGYQPTCWYPWPQGCPPCGRGARQAAGAADSGDINGVHVLPPPLESPDAEVIPTPEEYQPAPETRAKPATTGPTLFPAEKKSEATPRNRKHDQTAGLPRTDSFARRSNISRPEKTAAPTATNDEPKEPCAPPLLHEEQAISFTPWATLAAEGAGKTAVVQTAWQDGSADRVEAARSR